jgi:hypothetical protein
MFLIWYIWHIFYFPITQIKLLSRHSLGQENVWSFLYHFSKINLKDVNPIILFLGGHHFRNTVYHIITQVIQCIPIIFPIWLKEDSLIFVTMSSFFKSQ